MTKAIIINQDIENTLEENYMPYAMESILNRALPEIDGFKPSHRKLLYTMYKMNLLKTLVKSANITGQTLRLNPHGDSAIYETMVRMTDSNESLLVPFIEGKGNFGKVYSTGAFAHQRYTEAKLADISGELFKSIDRNSVDFIDNYDETMKEPVLLPVPFPSILCNVTQGIAVGMASNICSFNLKDVCEATIDYIKTGETDRIKLIPDFSTGGSYLYNESELIDINKTGRGSIKVRSNYRYNKVNNCIEITEIPYTTNVEQIIDKICDLIKSKKISEVIDVRDETDRGGLKLTIDVKKNTDIELLMTKLYKMTPLEDTFSCNFNMLIMDDAGKKKPMVVGTHDIIKEWCKWRISCLKRELQYNADIFTKELNKLYGLQKITVDIEKAIEVIRKSKTDEDVIVQLMAYFKIDKEQAESVSSIRLRNLNEDYVIKQLSEIKPLEEKLSKLNDTIQDNSKIEAVIVSQLNNIITKYRIDRKTEILEVYQNVEKVVAKIVDDYSCFVTITEDGYVKKMLRTTELDKVKIKDGDSIVKSWTTSNTSTLLIFTNKANCYKVLIDDLDTTTPSTLGTFLPTYLSLKDEDIVFVQLADSLYSGYLLNIYENNTMAKVPLSAFETKSKVSKLKNALSDDKLIEQIYITEDIDILCVSSIDRVILTNTEQFSPVNNKKSNGVILIKPKANSVLKCAIPISKTEMYQIEDLEYYRSGRGVVGKQLKEMDLILI